jgi:hypothetical protein
MSLRRLLGQTATIGHRAYDAVDSQGIPLPGTTTWSERPCRLERNLSDVLQAGDILLSDYRMFLEPDVTIDTLDPVIIEGVNYEVAAPPVVERSPRGPHHLVVMLIRRAPVRANGPGGS